MSVLNNITKRVSETAKAAAKKSGDIVEVTKLNMSIGTEEDKIKKNLGEIGKKIYDLFKKGEEIPAEVREDCDAIIECEKIIEETRVKILALRNMKTCYACGAELELDVAFCPKCGAKQETEKQPDET